MLYVNDLGRKANIIIREYKHWFGKLFYLV